MSAQNKIKRIGVPDIRARKGGEPLVCLTAYDAPMARLLDPHCDVLLVGDSLGMVVHGLDSTIGVTLDMMILHGQAVMRAAKQALVVIDLPFGTYEMSPEQAFESASRVLAETGAQAVKIESGVYAADTIRFLTERGIPVMGHVGLRPQAALNEGGFKAKGRDDMERTRVFNEAREADAAGAFAIVIEGVAENLAREITGAVKAPTIGIGASAACDGQILVTQDMLGLFDWTPKFVRRYAQLSGVVEAAVEAFAADVKSRAFPADAETYSFKPKSS
ncbi:3-methyl-2-oxobutanoate hydroxymethyltransferase [Hyphobacterium sp. CCMP332]|jgi:3-methyl-2-oxobutanoate hydroxymethyltransferase|uniref:3-methyl-2-oxobutanoate hydroxymethyltransferase n=1 Tax=Hyphobacterium sp. CCMP332 TaxID=2749086 RepID=UPI00164FBEF2|nr:3-methyl-2-oxobutanoate hydroxymethyltransferase [Hyphobacterium sp. CCMP332]QNL18519.1 3-methyl-2-oxobutanoate hydroxymethyltransferase [Hyphobacterium sp. CCMP332]